MTLKNFEGSSNFLMYTEAYDYFFRLVTRLHFPDMHVLLIGMSGRGKLQLAKFASSYLDREFIEILFGDEVKQYDSFNMQITRILNRAIIERLQTVIFIRLNEIKDTKVIAILKEIIEYLSFSSLPLDLNKIKESMPNNKFDMEDIEYIRNCYRRFVKFVFCET
jgi:P-loop containing dynein motor region D4